MGLKSVLRKNYDYKPQFFKEILKAVCLSVNWVPNLIQTFFPTMEQKFVQRSETEIVADACNASYSSTLQDTVEHCRTLALTSRKNTSHFRNEENGDKYKKKKNL